MTDKEKILAEIERLFTNYSSENTILAAGVRQALISLRSFIDSLHEEPVSEDLEEEVIKKVLYFSENFHKAPWAIDSTGAVMPIWYAKFGAKWQKQKDKSKVLTEEQCRKIRDDAFELGKDAMKQQLMAKAVDATVHIDAGGYPYIPQMELYDYDKDIPLAKKGDKVKLITIKED